MTALIKTLVAVAATVLLAVDPESNLNDDLHRVRPDVPSPLSQFIANNMSIEPREESYP